MTITTIRVDECVCPECGCRTLTMLRICPACRGELHLGLARSLHSVSVAAAIGFGDWPPRQYQRLLRGG
jgi:hypothetical protein